MPLGAVVSPAYLIYLSFFGLCANHQQLSVLDSMMIVHLPRSAPWFAVSWLMECDIPESKRSMIREGVPTPMPILEELAQKLRMSKRDRSEYLVLLT